MLERIGESGFGSAYLAEQLRPVRRRVALMIMKLGMDSRQVSARFEAERQALAIMDHPNISKVLDIYELLYDRKGHAITRSAAGWVRVQGHARGEGSIHHARPSP